MTGPLLEIRDVHRRYGAGPTGVVALAGVSRACPRTASTRSCRPGW